MNRRTILFAALFIALATVQLSAQVGLSLKTERKRYLRYEQVKVSLVIRNYSGNTLVFKDVNDKIFFNVNFLSGKTARCFDKQANPASGLILGPGEAKEVQVNLDSLYDLQKEGNYTVQACLNHSRLSRTQLSKTLNFEVREGELLKENSIGLPAMSSDEIIKSISLKLLKFPDADEMLYCLRAEDDENVYATIRLAPFIDGDAPMMDVDGTSTVHVLLQVRPRLYTYTLLNFVGRKLKLRQQRYYTLKDDKSAPYLQRQGDRVVLKGGRVAVEGVDFNQQ